MRDNDCTGTQQEVCKFLANYMDVLEGQMSLFQVDKGELKGENMSDYENYKMIFPYKGYGRIFVEKEEDIDKIKEIIKEIDDYEYDYMPDDLITVFSEENYHSKFVHKFNDMDMGKVLKVAWERGIKCFVVFGKTNKFDIDNW